MFLDGLEDIQGSVELSLAAPVVLVVCLGSDGVDELFEDARVAGEDDAVGGEARLENEPFGVEVEKQEAPEGGGHIGRDDGSEPRPGLAQTRSEI